MKVRVRLYGTLSQRFPDYRPSQGMEVEVPDGATAEDLMAVLGIPESHKAVVIAEGRVLAAGDAIRSGGSVNIVQSIGGG